MTEFKTNSKDLKYCVKALMSIFRSFSYVTTDGLDFYFKVVGNTLTIEASSFGLYAKANLEVTDSTDGTVVINGLYLDSLKFIGKETTFKYKEEDKRITIKSGRSNFKVDISQDPYELEMPDKIVAIADTINIPVEQLDATCGGINFTPNQIDLGNFDCKLLVDSANKQISMHATDPYVGALCVATLKEDTNIQNDLEVVIPYALIHSVLAEVDTKTESTIKIGLSEDKSSIRLVTAFIDVIHPTKTADTVPNLVTWRENALDEDDMLATCTLTASDAKDLIDSSSSLSSALFKVPPVLHLTLTKEDADVFVTSSVGDGSGAFPLLTSTVKKAKKIKCAFNGRVISEFLSLLGTQECTFEVWDNIMIISSNVDNVSTMYTIPQNS